MSRPGKRNLKDLRRSPFSTEDVKTALHLDGWTKRPGGDHQSVWEHPTKPGKFAVSEGWTGLDISCPVLRGMCRTCGLSKVELLQLLNGQKPR